jgi:small-conductance mechanosensitive channel
MHAPWFSTFTLITEALVTISVLYIFYSGYKKNKFPFVLTGITLAYEILFNISYMASRALSKKIDVSPPDSKLLIALAIFHGSFALLMFLALLVFMFFAWKNYKKGINFFQNHKLMLKIFIFCWLLAVISGFLFYYEYYFKV